MVRAESSKICLLVLDDKQNLESGYFWRQNSTPTVVIAIWPDSQTSYIGLAANRSDPNNSICHDHQPGQLIQIPWSCNWVSTGSGPHCAQFLPKGKSRYFRCDPARHCFQACATANHWDSQRTPLGFATDTCPQESSFRITPTLRTWIVDYAQDFLLLRSC